MVVACAAAVGGTPWPASAAADQTVVSTTIFPGTTGSYSTQPVPLSKLADSCPTYDGPSWTFASGQAPQASTTAWSLGDVISCGLGITQADVTAVQIFNNDNNTYENPLTPDEVFNPDTYPSGALPLISVDGTTTSGGPVTYTRPPTGPSDDAQSDQFQEDGTTPVSIDVYENQPPLTVIATSNPVSGTATTTSEQVTLSATVSSADGGAIDPSQLTWSWTFAGSPVGSGATPAVTIGAGESELATVIVTDQATGTGGTATFDVSYNPAPSPVTTTQPTDAGSSPQGDPTGQPHGKRNSHGKRKLKHAGSLDHAGSNPGAGATRPHRHSTTSSPTSPATTSATTPTTPATTPTSPPATPPTTQTQTVTTPARTPRATPRLTVDTSPTKAPRQKRAHAPRRRSVAQPGASQRLITGRLVADVQALPAGASPLVHPIAASAVAPSLVHGGSDPTSAPTWAYAALAVLALLGGGAVYERRGRRGRTLHR